MKEHIQFNENNYFNDKDIFLVFDASINKFLVTKTHLYNGSWYSNETLKYKMTSVKTLNCSKLLLK